MTTAAPIAQTFPKSARLRQRGDFVRVFDAGRRVAAPALALHALAAPRPRLGVAVSRKVDPNAVGRNRIKRVLRDAFRRLSSQLVPADYVVVARPPAAALDNAALRSVFATAATRRRFACGCPRRHKCARLARPPHPLPIHAGHALRLSTPAR